MINKILKAFTREYKRETKYIELMKNNHKNFKLNDNSEDIDSKIKRLKNNNFISNFTINPNDYAWK